MLIVNCVEVAIIMISITMPILWILFRNLKHAWIFQDILCMAICAYILKFVRLPSYKICTYLLSAYFCLDVFFVFITPFFTKDGKSIMGEIATAGIDNVFYKQSFMEEFAAGRKNVDLMPSLIQVRDIGFNPLGACTRNIMILGLGDIVFPGFLLSYCHAFDLMTNKKGLYYIISVITYGLGVLIVNIVTRYIESEQPALFYIVPTILIPPILFAWYRKELSLLWHGFHKIKRIRKQEIDTIELTANSANIQPNEILEEVNSHEQNI